MILVLVYGNLFSPLLKGVKNKFSSQKKITLWVNELNYPLYLAGTINNPLRVLRTLFPYTLYYLPHSQFITSPQVLKDMKTSRSVSMPILQEIQQKLFSVGMY